MNSSDDPIDKQLRIQFQQVFDEFEVAPANSLKTRIWSALPESVSNRYLLYSAVLISVLFLTGGFYYQSPSTVGERRKEVSPCLHVSPAQPPVDMVIITPQSKNRIWPESVRPVSTPGQWSGGWHPADLNVTLNALPDSRVHGATDTGYRVQAARSGNGRKPRFLIPVEQTAPAELRAAQFETDSGPSSRYSPLNGKPPISHGVALAGTAPSTRTESGKPVAAGNVPIAEHWQAWPTMQPIGRQSASGLSVQLTRTIEGSLPTVSALTSQPVGQTPLRWFVRIAPLSTSQRMTVVARPGRFVQHVDVPSARSGATWGFQLSGGITWRQWDVYVSYGQIRRWAYYQVATNDYEVEPVGTNEYQVTRRTQDVAENVSLPMLGAGVSRQYTLGNHKRYYGRLGGQLTYTLTDQQTLAWAQASLGLNLSLGKTYQLQVGPAVDYGLSRLWSAERQLNIHPYLIGASFTLYPKSVHVP